MLISLHVKNLALIKECEVFFGKGLNILTGETGAGKSVIIGSIRYALGEKADKECIRKDAEYALVELIFQTEQEEVKKQLVEMDIPMEEDGTLLIQRKIMPARSVCKVNGETIGSRQLKELASLLLNIHGQHDTQTLLNEKNQSQILDEFAGDILNSVKIKMQKAFQEYSSLKKEYQNALETDSSRDKETSLAEFEVKEIAAAGLKEGEDEELEEAYRKMNNSKKIAEAVSKAYQATGYEAEAAAGEPIAFALRELKTVASYDKELSDMEEVLLQIDELLNDFNKQAGDYLSSLEFSQEEYLEIENRLNTYHHLKNKYGNTVTEVLAYLEHQEKRLEQLSDYEGYLNNLSEQLKKAESTVLEYAGQAHTIRTKQAEILSKKLETSLLELNFSNVCIEVCVTADQNKMTADGYDETEFLISLNPGEAKKPLSLVASGGELSRIMLALKTIMADKEQIETLIFDEIDSGISGKTAWKVSEKMAVLGREHQLICITHLPQIAAMADSHFVIEKIADSQEAVTGIREIKDEDGILEIARLLGSSQITEAVLANAKELKEMANHTKRY